MQIQGDVSSEVQRRDQDFSDLHKYLTSKYPNVLVPHIDKNQQAKKFSDEYQESRVISLSRFVDYCLQSETIKQDALFEKFLEAKN